MDGCELIAFVSTISCAIVKTYGVDDITIIAAVLDQLSTSLSTYLAYYDICCDTNNQEEDPEFPPSIL